MITVRNTVFCPCDFLQVTQQLAGQHSVTLSHQSCCPE